MAVTVQSTHGSVKFSLVDRQLKQFKHGLQALHKIGTELLLEALPGKVRKLVKTPDHRFIRDANTSVIAPTSISLPPV
jgi:hypothetical protein